MSVKPAIGFRPIRQAGAVGLLHKPFSETSLIQAMRTMLELVDPTVSMKALFWRTCRSSSLTTAGSRALVSAGAAGIGSNFTEVNDGKQAVGALQNGFRSGRHGLSHA